MHDVVFCRFGMATKRQGMRDREKGRETSRGIIFLPSCFKILKCVINWCLRYCIVMDPVRYLCLENVLVRCHPRFYILSTLITGMLLSFDRVGIFTDYVSYNIFNIIEEREFRENIIQQLTHSVFVSISFMFYVLRNFMFSYKCIFCSIWSPKTKNLTIDYPYLLTIFRINIKLPVIKASSKNRSLSYGRTVSKYYACLCERMGMWSTIVSFPISDKSSQDDRGRRQ